MNKIELGKKVLLTLVQGKDSYCFFNAIKQMNLFSGGGYDAVFKEAGWNLGSSTARDPPVLLNLVRVPPFRCMVRGSVHGVCLWARGF